MTIGAGGSGKFVSGNGDAGGNSTFVGHGVNMVANGGSGGLSGTSSSLVAGGSGGGGYILGFTKDFDKAQKELSPHSMEVVLRF